MKYALSLIIFLLFYSSIFSQYTEVINSNRPGSSQGAFAVGRNVLQFELGVNFSDLSHKNLNFSYDQKPLIKNIHLEIKKGSKYGFFGKSGSGKSTLIDIILGVLPPTSGSLYLDGVDISENLRGWQNQIGYVPQEIFLSDDTLRRNIAFGLSVDDINDAAIQKAVSLVQLEKFIHNLPQGLDTIVGERGVRISGGQRQRIGIARALYHKPEVLVLDEATSNLDIKTEADLMDAIFALHGQKTIITVAHRLKTLDKCDNIYTLRNGKIIDEI